MHAGADDLLSRPIVLVVALAIVSLLPFAFMTVTAFVKIATVLQIVRSSCRWSTSGSSRLRYPCSSKSTVSSSPS